MADKAAMNGYQIVQIACLGITVACFPVIGFYLRKAARFNRITAKLRQGEPLTDREKALLDR